ncbi:MAG TPA: hypothetical protein PKE15_12990, partial [Ottowia sp.]|nr:hypothetical protein [Ottowia sp.]
HSFSCTSFMTSATDLAIWEFSGWEGFNKNRIDGLDSCSFHANAPKPPDPEHEQRKARIVAGFGRAGDCQPKGGPHRLHQIEAHQIGANADANLVRPQHGAHHGRVISGP